MDENLQTVPEVARILESLDVRWFLGGSLASSLHGIPRATLDADIVADLRLRHVKPLLQYLGNSWYADETTILEAISGRSAFNLIHLDSAMKVDVFVPKLRRFEDGQFHRAKLAPVTEGGTREVPVCSAVDIIAVKPEWFRLAVTPPMGVLPSPRSPQHPAPGRDIDPAPLAEGAGKSGGEENLLKLLPGAAVALDSGKTSGGIERDEIDVRVDACEQFSEAGGGLR